MGIIYKATNILNGKNYIGKTTQTLRQRKNNHKSDVNRGSDTHFHKALKKYGFDSFKWKIIDEHDDLDVLNQLERLHISRYESFGSLGYNLTPGGEGYHGENHPWFGKHHSEETRKKISKAQKGKRVGVNNPMFGRIFSEEHRKKIGKKSKGRIFSEESKLKMSKAHKGTNNYFYGKNHSQETKNKISKKLKGKTLPYSTRKKMSLARLKNKKYPGASYGFNRKRDPWLKVWESTIVYNKHRTRLGVYNDPISASIVYKFVYKEIYNEVI